MMSWAPKNQENKVKYIPSNKKNVNQAGNYAKNIMKSEIDRFEKGLDGDFLKLLNDNSTYIPSFFCKKDDMVLFDKLKEDMDKSGEMITWNKHFKHEDPTFSNTFNEIVQKMANHFNVEVLATRLNYYRDGYDYKTFHKDSHAYNNGQKEDFTMGASFGASRELEFKHDDSDAKFRFPQHNGDIFAFTSVVNDQFMHGVPKIHAKTGPRFSIIAWGRRKNLNIKISQTDL